MISDSLAVSVLTYILVNHYHLLVKPKPTQTIVMRRAVYFSIVVTGPQFNLRNKLKTLLNECCLQISVGEYPRTLLRAY